MKVLLALILLTTMLVIILSIANLLKKSSVEISSSVLPSLESMLRRIIFEFQSQMTMQLNATRQQLSQSKDLISQHTLKTMEIIKSMDTTMGKIIQEYEEARKLGQALKDILQAPKLRGSYGEQILEEILEKALPRGIWEKQFPIGGRERVDFVIKFKEVVIPIDSKFPRDKYLRYTEAQPEREKATCWKEFEKSVIEQMKSIKAKYIRPEEGTTDFALMFIPSDGIYYETVAEKNYLGHPSKIYDYAQKSRVFPVSPNTFYSFLQVLMLGFRNLEIIEKTKNLRKNFERLQKNFDHFYKKHLEVGNKLEDAIRAFDTAKQHITNYKKHLDKTLRLKELESSQPPSINDEESEKS